MLWDDAASPGESPEAQDQPAPLCNSDYRNTVTPTDRITSMSHDIPDRRSDQPDVRLKQLMRQHIHRRVTLRREEEVVVPFSPEHPTLVSSPDTGRAIFSTRHAALTRSSWASFFNWRQPHYGIPCLSSVLPET